MKLGTLKTAIVMTLALAASSAALAQASEADKSGDTIANTPLIGKLETCTTLTDDAERLACFDREVAGLVSATNEGEVRVVETEDIKQARRRLFGFSLPKINLFGGGEDEEEIELLQSTITKIRKVGAKEYHFWIEEGNAKWRMKGRTMRFRAPKVGDSVEFKPATMGTYWIRVNGRKGVRGNRIG